MTLSWAHLIVIVGCFGAWFSRYLFPNVRFEPPTRFRIGKPDDFIPGMVDTRFKKRHGVWERFQIGFDDAGTIVVDKSVVFRQEKDEWELPDSYVVV
jgi:hypothetical protein